MGPVWDLWRALSCGILEATCKGPGRVVESMHGLLWIQTVFTERSGSADMEHPVIIIPHPYIGVLFCKLCTACL